ncbi:MAG: TrmH family RNA methyltransferase [Saprospiraceae bacterium]|nr:TrmH family RNA methyltransferase [Saprospiraceae bacterium]
MARKKELSELNRLTSEEFIQSKKLPVILCADNIRSGHNIGSLFRIADAFCLESIILGPHCVVPPHQEILKTALGAQNHVAWESVSDLNEALGSLKQKGYRLVGIEQTLHSEFLHQYKIEKTQKYVIVLGHEVHGIQQEVLDILDDFIEIPQFGVKHSLNVSVAAGIVCWQFCERLL